MQNPIVFDEYRYWHYNDLKYRSYYNASRLKGGISPSLLKLKYLQHLDFSRNNFSGYKIPTFFGSFKYMTHLNLSFSYFHGQIPINLGNLSRLQYLDLTDNDYLHSKSLRWITTLPSLKSLNISYVNLSEANDWLQAVNMLPSLFSLNLRYCSLQNHLFLSDNNLTSLVSLDFSRNEFNFFPLWWFNFTSIEILDLESNFFRGKLPNLFQKLTSLTKIDLSSNKLNSSFPNSLCTLTNLSHIDLSSNSFEEKFPSCLENLTSLTTLRLRSNRFQGALPFEIGHLQKLTELDISWNELNGSIPLSCLENLTSLTILRLGGNRFQGALPYEIGHFQKLTKLDLSGNELNGTIPPSLGQLEKLQYLDISYNAFNGEPPSLGQLEKLQYLDTSYNAFNGEVTDVHFAKLAELKQLYISSNSPLRLSVNSQWFPPFQLHEIYMFGIQVGPQFPQWLETQKKVEVLEMSNVSIIGQIPNWFEVIYANLNALVLSHNQISGKPPLIKGSSNFVDLDLSFNKFDGSLNSIPRYIGSLDMSSNNLTGQIPPLDDNYAVELFLNDNGFTGNIPITICNQEALYYLDFSNNHLSGEIPFCMGHLRNLDYLNLANNRFSGQIPASFGNLGKGLQSLLLRGNKFHGELPSSFQNLTSLELLDLGNNQLSSTLPTWLGTSFRNMRWLRLQSNNFNGIIPLELCKLPKLKVSNLAQKSFTGFIPPCFGNFNAMRKDHDEYHLASYLLAGYPSALQHELLSNPVKGRDLWYSMGAELLTSIALFENKIVGEIPKELMNLDGLQILTLSKNHLEGKIPQNIGNLKSLESLDLSMNELSGSIPPSLATIDTLGYLNLSFNKLSGPIPQGNHFQTFDNKSIYEGNRGLCGRPISDNCVEKKPSKKEGSINLVQADFFDIPWFCAGIGPGFAAGFVGIFCVLRLKKSWRYAYFKLVQNICSRMQRKSSWDRS